LQIKPKIVSCHTTNSEPVKQEVNGTVILPLLVFPGPKHCLAAWLLGCLAAWLLGCLAAWLLGCLAAWLHGCIAAWLLGCLAAWVLGCLAAWLLGCLAAFLLSCLADRLIYLCMLRRPNVIRRNVIRPNDDGQFLYIFCRFLMP
jgi:hypothetical protein